MNGNLITASLTTTPDALKAARAAAREAKAAEKAALAAERAAKAEAKLAAQVLKLKIDAIYLCRRERLTHPEGDFDKQGRWYPSERERSNHLCGIRQPSRNWPYSYMLACRTRKHISELAEVEPQYFEELYREALAIEARTFGDAKTDIEILKIQGYAFL